MIQSKHLFSSSSLIVLHKFVLYCVIFHSHLKRRRHSLFSFKFQCRNNCRYTSSLNRKSIMSRVSHNQRATRGTNKDTGSDIVARDNGKYYFSRNIYDLGFIELTEDKSLTII